MSHYSLRSARCRFDRCGRIFYPTPETWQHYCCRDCAWLDHGIGPESLPLTRPAPSGPISTAIRGLLRIGDRPNRDNGRIRVEIRREDTGGHAYVEPWNSPSPSCEDVEPGHSRSLPLPRTSSRGSDVSEDHREPGRLRATASGPYRRPPTPFAREQPPEDPRTMLGHDGEWQNRPYNMETTTQAPVIYPQVPLSMPVPTVVPPGVPWIPAGYAPPVPPFAPQGFPANPWPYAATPQEYWASNGYAYRDGYIPPAPPAPYVPGTAVRVGVSGARPSENPNDPSFNGGPPPYPWEL